MAIPKRTEIRDTPKITRVVEPRRLNYGNFTQSYKPWIKRKTKKSYFTHRDTLLKVTDKIFSLACEALTERDGGAVLEGIGYFAFYMPMYRRFHEYTINDRCTVAPFYERDYYNYIPRLFTDIFTVNRLKGWSMDNGFKRTIKKRIKRHRKFKLYYKEVVEIYNNRK